MASPFDVWAQQPSEIIGFLGAGGATAWAPMVASFEQRLAELGWINGRINLKTAKALGLEISPTLLARADEVIE